MQLPKPAASAERNPSRLEPRLGDVLADPVIQAVMLADRVDPEALRSSLREMAQRIASTGPAARPLTGQAECRGLPL